MDMDEKDKSINLNVIIFLLERGADRNIKNIHGLDAY